MIYTVVAAYMSWNLIFEHILTKLVYLLNKKKLSIVCVSVCVHLRLITQS